MDLEHHKVWAPNKNEPKTSILLPFAPPPQMPTDELSYKVSQHRKRPVRVLRMAALRTLCSVQASEIHPISPTPGRPRFPVPHHQASPAVFMSVVESVGTTRRGTAGLGERAGELGSQEPRSSKEKFSCKSNVAVDSNRGDWVSGRVGSTRLSQQHGGREASVFLPALPRGTGTLLGHLNGSSGKGGFESTTGSPVTTTLL